MKTGTIIDSVDVSNRQKRKAAVSLAIELLEKVRFAEEAYLARIPPNLYGSSLYAASDEAIDILTDAILTLMPIYDC